MQNKMEVLDLRQVKGGGWNLWGGIIFAGIAM